LVGFQFTEGRLDLPALEVQFGQLIGWRQGGVGDGGQQAVGSGFGIGLCCLMVAGDDGDIEVVLDDADRGPIGLVPSGSGARIDV